MLNLVTFAIILTVCASLHHAENKTHVKLYKKTPRWFTWPGLVRIENDVCNSTNSLMGTCYTRWQCKSISGVLGGKCHGVGTCCIVQQSCGTVTSYNNTYFLNPGYPAAYSGTGICSIVIQRCHDSICQVRLDFNVLQLSQPNTQGICDQDALYITGGASQFTPICGENNGQHVYMNFNGNTDIRITINISPNLDFERSFQIKISQIDCGCPTTAPSGCLMYYTDLSGTVSSFNYGATIPTSGTRQIANTNYGICVAMQPGYCGIRWSASSATSFTVTGDGTPTAPPIPMVGTNCIFDYVIIPNPVGLTVDRFCGTSFEGVTTFSKPFILTVVTNENEVNDIANRGFSIDYQQIECGINMIP